jgi:hypothetical protein
MGDVLPDIPVPPGLFAEDPPQQAEPTGDSPAAGAVTAAQAAADPAELLCGDIDRLEAQVLEILAAAQHRDVAEVLAEGVAVDDGAVIDSLAAVFVVQVVEHALGGYPLRLRGQSKPDDFRSSHALARLLRRLLASRQASA